MRVLTKIDNGFRIRHDETTATEITRPLVDYLFVRVYTLLQRLHPGIVAQQ
jgi:hypothetical protein